MNAAVRAAVRLGLDRGHRMFAIKFGFEGLIQGDISEVDWMTVNGWSSLGGTVLGTSRYLPKEEMEWVSIENNLQSRGVNGLIIIGGWEGLNGLLMMERRQSLKGIVKIIVPATISNNLPGTEFSIGSDTALNCTVSAVDKIKQSAVSVGRVFVVEVMGNKCGYLPLMTALASGAETVYLPEEGINLEKIQKDCQCLIKRFQSKGRDFTGGVGLILVNEGVSDVYDSSFLTKILGQEGKGVFSARRSVLGHIQQGGTPSPADRIRSVQMAARAIYSIETQTLSTNSVKSGVVGEIGRSTTFTPLDQIEAMMDVKNRRPNDQWWMKFKSVFNTLAVPKALNMEES